MTMSGETSGDADAETEIETGIIGIIEIEIG